MHSNGNADKLLEVVRTEKDPKVRIDAMRALASQRTGVNADTLVSLYNAEQDPQIKQSILDGLFQQRNAKALVDIARAEKDTKMKLRIVERLVQHEVQGSPGLPRGDPEQMKPLLWLMAARSAARGAAQAAGQRASSIRGPRRPAWNRPSGRWSPRSPSRPGSLTACLPPGSTWGATTCATAGTSPA